MFCINCGTKLPDDAKFCYNCGKKLDVKLSPAEPQVLKDEEKSLKEEKVNILNEYPKQEKTVSAKKEKEKTEVGFDIKRFIPIIGVGVIAVIFMVLLFFGWNMLFGRREIPDPEHYFKKVAAVTLEKQYGEYCYTITSKYDITAAVEEYCDIITKDYYFEELESSNKDRYGNFTRSYKYKGVRFGFTGSDDIYVDFNGPGEDSTVTTGTLKLYIDNYEKLDLIKLDQYIKLLGSNENSTEKETAADTEKEETDTPSLAPASTPTPTPTATPTPTPTPEPAAGPEVLPNFTKIAEKYDGELNRRSDESYILYYFGDSIPKTPIDDYIEALEAKGYKVTDSEIGGSRYHDLYEWWLTNSAVDAIDIHGDHKGQVYVKFNDAENYSEVTVEFSNGIKMEGYKDEPYPSVDPDDFWEDCPNCINGVCSNCGGSGKDSKFQAGLGWVEQDCLSCRDGECKYCDGDGYLGH